jgi:hypothetical protein
MGPVLDPLASQPTVRLMSAYLPASPPLHAAGYRTTRVQPVSIFTTAVRCSGFSVVRSTAALASVSLTSRGTAVCASARIFSSTSR